MELEQNNKVMLLSGYKNNYFKGNWSIYEGTWLRCLSLYLVWWQDIKTQNFTSSMFGKFQGLKDQQFIEIIMIIRFGRINKLFCDGNHKWTVNYKLLAEFAESQI